MTPVPQYKKARRETGEPSAAGNLRPAVSRERRTLRPGLLRSKR